jgi:benzoyl-CoA 2,3-dioxygenase component B
MVSEDAPALSALNMRLRDDYLKDCGLGLGRWNKVIEGAGIQFQLKLPHQAFFRKIGEFSAIHTDPEGNVLSDSEWEKRSGDYLPSDNDRVYIESLMQPVIEPGKFAGWIAPPKVGIDNKPGDFEYVKLA